MTNLRKQEKNVENSDIIALFQTIKHFMPQSVALDKRPLRKLVLLRRIFSCREDKLKVVTNAFSKMETTMNDFDQRNCRNIAKNTHPDLLFC